METIIYDNEVRRGEPEAVDVLSEALDEAKQVDAKLSSISRDRATWTLESGETIECGLFGSYGPICDEEWKSWVEAAFNILQASGKDLNKLSIPGKLSFCRGVIFGWQEDENHPDSLVMLCGEVMCT